MNQLPRCDPRRAVDLHRLGQRLMRLARPRGTSALTLEPSTPVLDKMLVALTCDTALDPRRWAAPTSVFVLSGSVRFPRDGTVATSGSWAPLPTDGSPAVACEDTYLLLVVGPDI